MSRAVTIARREFFSYLFSPIAYVAMALFLGVAGFFFQRDFEPGQCLDNFFVAFQYVPKPFFDCSKAMRCV